MFPHYIVALRIFSDDEEILYLKFRGCCCCIHGNDISSLRRRIQKINNLLKLTVLQNKSRKFNEWLFDPDHFAGKWHKKNMLRDFQDS